MSVISLTSQQCGSEASISNVMYVQATVFICFVRYLCNTKHVYHMNAMNCHIECLNMHRVAWHWCVLVTILVHMNCYFSQKDVHSDILDT